MQETTPAINDDMYVVVTEWASVLVNARVDVWDTAACAYVCNKDAACMEYLPACTVLYVRVVPRA